MTREVRFNPLINQDDGLLANSYAKKYTLSFNDARVLLNSDIRVFTDHLETEREVSMGRLGTLSLGEDNNLLFKPAVSAARLSEETGFYAVDNRKSVEEKPVERESHEVVRKLDFEKNYYIAINKKFTKVAAIFILMATAALSLLMPTADRKQEDRASVIPVMSIENTVSREKTVQDEKADKIQDNSTASVSITENKNSENDEPSTSADTDNIDKIKKYYLIVGTFRSQSEADAFVSLYGNKGYKLSIIPSKTLYRVSAKGSVDKAELIEELNSSRFTGSYKEGWIWTR